MPRDGSGVYTLPAGNPVVVDTIISTDWANPTMSDIAAQLNNVYTRDGVLGPTGPFKIVDGTVNAPGIAWNSEPGLGWFRPSASVIHTAAQGAITTKLDAAIATGTIFNIYPRANGDGSINVTNQPAGSANYNYLNFSQRATGGAFIQTYGVGSAVRGNLHLVAPVVQISEVLEVLSGAVIRGNAQFLSSNTFFNPASGNMVVSFNRPTTADFMSLNFTAGGVVRWLIDPGEEVFGLYRYANDGSYLGNPFNVNRSTGMVFAESGLYVNNALPVGSGGALQWNAASRPGLSVPGLLAINWSELAPGFRDVTFCRVNAMGVDAVYQMQHNTGAGMAEHVFTIGSMIFRMATSGDATAPGTWKDFSDRQLKTNLAPIDNAMARVAALTGYTYDRPDLDNRRMAGLIAQDLQVVLPEAVSTATHKELGEVLATSASGVVALLINAVKELNERITQLETT